MTRNFATSRLAHYPVFGCPLLRVARVAWWRVAYDSDEKYTSNAFEQQNLPQRALWFVFPLCLLACLLVVWLLTIALDFCVPFHFRRLNRNRNFAPCSMPILPLLKNLQSGTKLVHFRIIKMDDQQKRAASCAIWRRCDDSGMEITNLGVVSRWKTS